MMAVVLMAIGHDVATLHAQALTADTLSIRFRLDSIRIDMGYENNELHWNAFEQNFKKHFSHYSPASLRLDVYAGASPEGTAIHNRWLGENRGLAIRRLVRYRLGNSVGSIVVHNEAARWDGLYDVVAASNEPWRDEVLRIIEMPATADQNKRDHREYKLRQLHGGKLWPVLLEKYLAPLRSGATAILSWQGGGRDTIVVRDTVVLVTPVVVGGPTGGTAPAEQKPAPVVHKRDTTLLYYPAWAIKTNLLMWGVVAPNIEVEIPLGRKNRWSLEVEYFTPWFIWANNMHASQFQNLGAELRYWPGNRRQRRWLEGWHLGLAVAAGYYDWEWKAHEGYQGEYVNTYFNMGYQHRMGKHWALDFSLGLGLMATKYRHYYGSSVYPDTHLTEHDELLIWHDTGNTTWLGPNHVSLSLVYMFNAWPFHFKPQRINR